VTVIREYASRDVGVKAAIVRSLTVSEEDKCSDRVARLMHRVKLGDASAFASLYRLTAADIHHFVRRRLAPATKDDAADIVQEVFIGVWRCATNFREDCAVEPWLRGIARHVLLRRLREKTPLVCDPVIAETAAASREPLKSNLDLDPLIQDLRRLMDKLPESQRQAFTLVHMEGLSRAEAAIRLRCTLPQLRDRLYEAKLRLRGSVKGWNK